MLVGAVGSVGFLLRAGQRTPRLLLVLFVLWVLSPFMAVVLADVGFEALVGSYPSDALLRDAGSHAGLFGHLRR